ncbi:MAG: sll0787 family AIR synthase-like protein [Elainellaceae cyanobacterium]
MTLIELAALLRRSAGITGKQDIQVVARQLEYLKSGDSEVLLGDDCAALLDQDGYLLLAAEGILPSFVDSDPWFAGWCAVMVNVSDVYAMGGHPIAVVDTVWGESVKTIRLLCLGMQDAARVYQVPIVGGHTNCHSPYNALSVSILGRATHLISSFNARPGDRLLAAIDFRGMLHPNYPFWNAATSADSMRLRQDLELLPRLSKMGLCNAGKDISMGGIVGTLLMLMETSGCGAILELDRIPVPKDLPLETWLLCFPSYGFLLSICPESVEIVRTMFHQRDLVCEDIGHVIEDRHVVLRACGESTVLWNFSEYLLTGFSKDGE